MDFTSPKYYQNRELSWIAFNYRVLGEAMDPDIPFFFSAGSRETL